MSMRDNLSNRDERTSETAADSPTPKKRRIGRIFAWRAGSLFLVLVLLIVGAAFYTTTADFQRRVGGEVV